jgi:hypothetical protein
MGAFMVHQLTDKYLKEMVERYLQEFLALLQPGGAYEIVSTALNKELIVRRRESDFVVKVRIGRRVFLFHFEFLSQYRRAKVREAYGYGGALTLKYKCDVATVLYVLKAPSRKPQALGTYEVAPFGNALNQHTLAVVKLWELREAILAGQKEYLALVPLLPEISANVDRKLLQRQRELIEQVQDPARRAELKFYTMAFAQKYFSTKFLKHFFEEQKMNEHWEQVPIFGEHIRRRAKESRQEGLEEGREEGLAVVRANISEVLRLRFGVANGEITRAIKAIDEPKKLKTVFRQALRADSLAAVKSVLAAEKPSRKKSSRSKRQAAQRNVQ